MKKIWARCAALAGFLMLPGCVGTDFISDSLLTMPGRVEIRSTTMAVEVNDTLQLNAVYLDEQGREMDNLSFDWESSDPLLASVESGGLLVGHARGQVTVTAAYNGTRSEDFFCTVVADPQQIATIVLSPDSAALPVGAALQFRAVAFNVDGDSLPGKTFQWLSSDTTILTVDGGGLATARSAGHAEIRAVAEGISSPLQTVAVSNVQLTGNFVPRTGTGYSVSGVVTLTRNSDGSHTLTFGDDFTCSNGPDLEVFLSATAAVTSASLNLGDLMSNSGAQSYRVSPGQNVGNRTWVIIHCVPFNVTFGYAELQ